MDYQHDLEYDLFGSGIKNKFLIVKRKFKLDKWVAGKKSIRFFNLWKTKFSVPSWINFIISSSENNSWLAISLRK